MFQLVNNLNFTLNMILVNTDYNKNYLIKLNKLNKNILFLSGWQMGNSES
jgi:hypothetical protein